MNPPLRGSSKGALHPANCAFIEYLAQHAVGMIIRGSSGNDVAEVLVICLEEFRDRECDPRLRFLSEWPTNTTLDVPQPAGTPQCNH